MNRIRVLRQARGWTQVQLAKAAGCGQSTLSAIELGKANPTQRQLEAIARALGVPLAHLFATSDDEISPAPMKGCAF